MLEQEVVIQNHTGLHARPAQQLVKLANEFSSDIMIVKENKQVNAKSILGVLSLGAGKGSVLTIKVSGSDQEEALKSLVAFINTKFDE